VELPRSELLSWKQINELDRAGIEFGSHTRSHPDLTKLDLAAAEAELISSKAIIEDKLGRKTHSFAYPFGRHNEDVKRMASINFQSSCSTNLGKVTSQSDLSLLERIDSYYLLRKGTLERLSTSAFDRYLSVRQAMRTFKTLVRSG
jgi:peptidoglycan/xylan/chitin deacetylase (PgdA/CDA1 family)